MVQAVLPYGDKKSMSETKFNDARVLRSIETTLRLEEVKLLYSNLESGKHDAQDLQKLTSIGEKLEEAMGAYYKQAEAVITQARINVLTTSVDPNATQQAVNIVLNQLDMTQGQSDASDIILTLPEWQWIMDRWRKNVDFSGIKEIRLKILRIQDAVENARGVRFIGSHVWIQGEPNPSTPEINTNGHEALPMPTPITQDVTV